MGIYGLTYSLYHPGGECWLRDSIFKFIALSQAKYRIIAMHNLESLGNHKQLQHILLAGYRVNGRHFGIYGWCKLNVSI